MNTLYEVNLISPEHSSGRCPQHTGSALPLHIHRPSSVRMHWNCSTAKSGSSVVTKSSCFKFWPSSYDLFVCFFFQNIKKLICSQTPLLTRNFSFQPLPSSKDWLIQLKGAGLGGEEAHQSIRNFARDNLLPVGERTATENFLKYLQRLGTRTINTYKEESRRWIEHGWYTCN